MISDTPEVQIEPNLNPPAVPEDLESLLNLKCLADANPPANIKWFKDSVPISLLPDATALLHEQIQINGNIQSSELRFAPVKSRDAGLYSCKATNNVGESAAASYRLDVQCS